jgi:hypothetical protein
MIARDSHVRHAADDGRELAHVTITNPTGICVEVISEVSGVQQRVEGALKGLGREALEALRVVVAEVGQHRVDGRAALARRALHVDEGVDLRPGRARALRAAHVVVGRARDEALEAHAHGERLARLAGGEVVARVRSDVVALREVGRRRELRAPAEAAVRAVGHVVERELAGLARVGQVRLLGLLRERNRHRRERQDCGPHLRRTKRKRKQSDERDEDTSLLC